MKRASKISVSAVTWWCVWGVLGCQGLVNRAGGSWNGYQYHTYPHPDKKPVVPRDIMVNVINSLGLRLLAIHNEYNENNIAISPYGALSVLIALGEGLQGEAVREIQNAAHIPNDISLIRVGLRDIHRHLKSYFIPKEGFLAGLTLNHENVTLRPIYQEILKFYGFDAPSFNNALYPEPQTTEKPSSTVNSQTTQPFLTTPPILSTTATPPSSEDKTPATTTEVTTTISGGARELDPVTSTPPTTSETVSTTQSYTSKTEQIFTLQPEFMIATTTEEPQNATLVPVVTTTTKAGIETPSTTSITTQQPTTTSKLAIATAQTSTSEPAITTPEPVISTELPIITTFQPVSDKLEAVTTTMETLITTLQPVATTIQPATVTSELVITTPELVITTPKSVTTTVEPVISTLEPVITTIEPVITTLEPVITTTEAVITTVVPVTTTNEGVITTLEPVTTATEAVITTLKPVTTSSEAVITTLEPVTTTTEAVITTLKPVTTTSGAVITTLEPVTTTTETVITTLEPVTTKTEEVITTLEPFTPTIEAVITTLEPVVTTLEPEMTIKPEIIGESVITTFEPVITPAARDGTTLEPESETHFDNTTTDPITITSQQEVVITTLVTGTTETEQLITKSVSEPETNVVLDVDSVSNSEPTVTEDVNTVTSNDPEENPTSTYSSTSVASNEPTEIPQKNISDNEILPDDSEGPGFAGASQRRARSQFNVIELNRWSEKPTTNRRRKARSMADYVIARYYDNHASHPHFHRPFMGEEQPSFLVQGKYKQYGINFMKYDTVLPFVYLIHLDALALAFPLDSSKYYLLLLLPRDEQGVDKLICDLQRNGNLRSVVDNLRYRRVVATIPSFMLKGYVNLTPSFQELGIKRVFEPRQSDFSPMTDQQGIYVRNIEQAITVNIRNYVDPNTLGSNRRQEDEEPIEFKAEHPFLYFVMDSELHIVLMEGKVVNPLNSRIR
ncbi:serpin 85F isoform X1 [Leptinotarsa decemlineata]|uniref:serpin 85F isoform X1 n=1 Tax=Leptinotarsa decemlineata TaxID=7539 RepID=UPI003D3095EC